MLSEVYIVIKSSDEETAILAVYSTEIAAIAYVKALPRFWEGDYGAFYERRERNDTISDYIHIEKHQVDDPDSLTIETQ